MGIFKMEDYHIGTAIKANFDTIQELQENKGYVMTGLSTGFKDLDRLRIGLNKGDLIILASCPHMGKTAFALNIARNVAVGNRIPVLMFSFVDTREQLSMRMLCSEAEMELYRLKAGGAGSNDWERLRRAGELLSQAPIYIDDTPGNSITEMKIKAGELKEQAGTCFIVIDYLQLITCDPETRNRRMELFEMLETLKRVAETLDIPIMVLYQINSDVVERSDNRPNLIDLADAESLDQYADLILFIYRDEVYNILKDGSNRGLAQIIIGKNRRGTTGMVTLRFICQIGLFKDFES